MSAVEDRLRKSLASVRERMAMACRRSGRSPGEVRLVVVTKGATTEEAKAVLGLGVLDLGENRVQEGARKQAELPPSVRWHMVGRLQTNKISGLLSWATELHSLDRPDLAASLERRLARLDRLLPVYLEVNVTGDDQKAGVRPEDVEGWLTDLRSTSPHLQIIGLMTMAPHGASESQARQVFRTLRELKERCGLGELSMGMSDDFEWAIEEGGTVIRVGRAVFEV